MILLRAFVVSLALVATAQAETRFLAAFDDVPLAPGLSERAEAAFVFAGAGGRIAETAASGAASATADVRRYYAEALPALGWALEQAGEGLVGVRGRERLTLAFVRGSDDAVTVRFRLVSRPASLALD